MDLGPATGEGGASGEADYVPASRPWRISDGALQLIGSRCAKCGNAAFPPHRRCPACGAEDGQAELALSPVGTLYTFSEIHVAPEGFSIPYAVGYVDLPEGVRVFGQIDARAENLKIGQSLVVKLGEVRTREGRSVIGCKFTEPSP